MSSDVWRYVERQARAQSLESSTMFERLMEVEEKLQRNGFHPMSDWWKETFRIFYLSGKSRLVIRVGRRGGKSSDLCRIAVVETLYGNHFIPTGDIGFFAFVSVDRDEAKERLNTICKILDILQIPYSPTKFEIRLRDRPLGFKVLSCSLRTSVGRTCIGMVCDELARWRDEDTGANPATQVLATLRPSLAGQKEAKEFLSSSPWSTLDAHHEHFMQGETDKQMVAFAATWVARPNLSMEECRKLEEDEETFWREYGAIPMKAGTSVFLDPQAVDDAVLPQIPMLTDGDELVAGADFGFRSDFSALVIAFKRIENYYAFDLTEVRPQPNQPLKPSETCKEFAMKLKRQGLQSVMADGHYRESVVEHLSEYKIAFIDAPTANWGCFIRMRALLHQGRAFIPNNRNLIRDLKEINSRPTRNGGLSILLPRRSGGGHSDMVSALVLALVQKVGRLVNKSLEPATVDKDEEEMKAYAELLKDKHYERYTEEEWITEDS